ncbi:hypothetical protein [Caulobacter sp.]|uniref:hypothetical protein n=1 Tax=Caulobacter sp. TaxID=78 RepID=UPI002B483E64|nr:hypothetical protein [Caulobacter sp.]HJV41477.1 hypothetical protein [Caulobacter sp.]
MQISQISTRDAGRTSVAYPGGLAAAAAALNDTSGAVGLDQQLSAYHALASRWNGAGFAERANLTQALTESPFAKTIQSALNTFTRAAWAGADAVPPAPQQRALTAFDGLSETDQAIIASLQVGVRDSQGPSSVADYRGRLQADLESAQPAPAEPRDSITLSAEAQARLAGGAAPDSAPATPVDATPEMAAAISAYGKVAR